MINFTEKLQKNISNYYFFSYLPLIIKTLFTFLILSIFYYFGIILIINFLTEFSLKLILSFYSSTIIFFYFLYQFSYYLLVLVFDEFFVFVLFLFSILFFYGFLFSINNNNKDTRKIKFGKLNKYFVLIPMILYFIKIEKNLFEFEYSFFLNLFNINEFINNSFLILLVLSFFFFISNKSVFYNRDINLIEILTVFFLVSLLFIFKNNSNSLLFFFFIVEIFSIYYFILIFSEKKINNGLIRFYSISVNILGSILMLLAIFIFYSFTGCFLLLPEIFMVEGTNLNLFGFLFFSFIFVKFGYFLILPLYVNFYSSISLKTVFFSIVIIKSLIIWFCFSNISFINNLINFWFDSQISIVYSFYWFFVFILMVSLIIAVYFAKQLFRSNTSILIFLSSFISSQSILLIFFSQNFILNPRNFILNSTQYFILSTFFLFSIFLASSSKEFYFSTLLYVGFPGVLFFVKLGLFNILMFSGLPGFVLISLLSSLFLLFIQEFLFSNKLNKNILFIKNKNIITFYSNFFVYFIIISILLSMF